MTLTLSPTGGSAASFPLALHSRQATARPSLPRSSGPCCSLKAQPRPQPQPAPSWDELLGQR